MSDVKIERKKVEDLDSDPLNVNKHTVRGHQVVENSLRKRGAFRSVAAAGKGVERPVIYAGNLTAEKAVDAGITDAVFVHTTGDQLVVVVRDDIAPGSPEAIALGLEDNESSKVSYAPDLDLVAQLKAADGGLLSGLMKQDDVLAGLVDQMTGHYFTPNTDPTFSPREVKDEDIIKTKDELENKFTGNPDEQLLKVLCPHCAEEFYIRKDKEYN